MFQAAGVTSTIARANEAWKAAGVQRVTLHECRHSFLAYDRYPHSTGADSA